MTHEEQTEEPSLENIPPAQLEHSESPIDAADLPAEQLAHVAEPAEDEYLPAAQLFIYFLVILIF